MLPQPAVGTSIRSNSIRQMPQASSQPVGAERNALAQSMQLMGAVMSFPRNSEIFGENEPADYVYRVISGSVRTYKILSDGRRQVGGFYLPGDIFGLEFAEEHTFSAEAITDAKVVVVKRSAIDGARRPRPGDRPRAVCFDRTRAAAGARPRVAPGQERAGARGKLSPGNGGTRQCRQHHRVADVAPGHRGLSRPHHRNRFADAHGSRKAPPRSRCRPRAASCCATVRRCPA